VIYKSFDLNRTTTTPQPHHTGNRNDRCGKMKILARVFGSIVEYRMKRLNSQSLRQTFVVVVVVVVVVVPLGRSPAYCGPIR